MTSSQTLAGLEVTGPAGMILFSPTASTPALTVLDDNFLRLHPTNLDLSRALANHIFTACGLSSMAVLYDEDNAAYSQTYVKGFIQVYRLLGGELTAEIGFSSQEYDPGMLASAALDGDPQGVLIVAAGSDTALTAQHIRLLDTEVPLFTTAWAQTETLVKNGGAAVEGIELVQAYDASYNTPASQNFFLRYQERFGSNPNFAAGMAFETSQMLISALLKDGGEPAGLRQALLDTQNFQGLNGKISMDPYGDVIRSLYLSTLKDGHFVNDGILPGEKP
jgi:branched-chain amino acid transport system substrate-binding protein